MATQHSTKEPKPAHTAVGVASKEDEEKAREEAKEASEKAAKEKPKPQAQIDAERAQEGADVEDPAEQGKPTDAREWTALERERQRKADQAKFAAEYDRKVAEQDAKASKG